MLLALSLEKEERKDFTSSSEAACSAAQIRYSSMPSKSGGTSPRARGPGIMLITRQSVISINEEMQVSSLMLVRNSSSCRKFTRAVCSLVTSRVMPNMPAVLPSPSRIRYLEVEPYLGAPSAVVMGST